MWRPGDNIGVGCRASHLVGIDLDPGADGIATFAALCAARSQRWPDTLTVRPSPVRPGTERPNDSAPSSVRSGLGPGIDTRGPGHRRGGYLIGPGSIVDGRPYLIAHDRVIRELPGWLTGLLEDQVNVHATVSGVLTSVGHVRRGSV